MEQKSVVLVRFPFSNQIDYKIRPAIIVSNNNYNKSHSDFWIVPMTTNRQSRESEIEIIPEDFVAGSTKEKSFVRADFIATIEGDLILKELGKVSDGLFRKIVIGIEKNIK